MVEAINYGMNDASDDEWGDWDTADCDDIDMADH